MNLAIDNPIHENAVHTLARLIVRLIIGVFLLETTALAGQPPNVSKQPSIRPLLVDSQFRTTTVNDKVLISTQPPRLPIIDGMIPVSFSPNTDPGQVMIGPAYAQPQALVYLPIINQGNQKRKLVVDLDHNRCDTLDAFLLSVDKKPISLGKLFRGLPLVKRPLPIRTYALPFELAPSDTIGLLLHSRRTTGIHELSITVSTQAQFVIKHDQDQFIRLAALSSAFFLCLRYVHWG